MNRSALVAGPTFVALGTTLLLDEAGRLDALAVIADWWPLVLLLVALSQLVVRPRHPVAAGLIGLVGGVALLVSLGVVWSAAVLWPLALIGLGLVLITRPARAPKTVWTADGDVVALWDEQVVHAPSGPYNGQAYTALFADLRIDLGRVLPAPDARVQLTSVFGDIEVEVPGDWEVVVDGPQIFGSVRVDPPVRGAAPDRPAWETPRVRLAVVAVFGDIRVRRAVAVPA